MATIIVFVCPPFWSLLLYGISLLQGIHLICVRVGVLSLLTERELITPLVSVIKMSQHVRTFQIDYIHTQITPELKKYFRSKLQEGLVTNLLTLTTLTGLERNSKNLLSETLRSFCPTDSLVSDTGGGQGNGKEFPTGRPNICL